MKIIDEFIQYARQVFGVTVTAEESDAGNYSFESLFGIVEEENEDSN